MIRKEKDGIVWLEFELLADIKELKHAVFLRHGGVCGGAHSSLHMGKCESELTPAVLENRSRIQKILKVEHLIAGDQMHQSRVVAVSHPVDAECDGLMTAHTGLGLMIKHADCQAAIFYDPEHRAVANVHCGWRGNVQNIYRETVGEMRKHFASRPENILVAISPSLGPEKAEFIHFRQELPESFLPYQVKPTYFDLWAISRMQLESEGILPHHIQIASICTHSHPEDYFSFRRDNRVTGNHGTVALLN